MISLTQSMFCFQQLRFRYCPFPIGHAAQVFDPALYESLLTEWPATDQFIFKANLGNKYSLSEVNNPDGYHAFIAQSQPWREVYRHVKSVDFVRHVLTTLAEHKVDLGLSDFRVGRTHQLSGFQDKLHAAIEKLTHRRNGARTLSTRFEFSMLPSTGGYIKPHTDAPQKLITLVVSMVRPDEWDASWGGGTTVLQPKDETLSFNWMNRQAEFDAMETLDSLPFHPNQCVVFVKTFNSWHAVSPMTSAGPPAMRKTLTINIESWGN